MRLRLVVTNMDRADGFEGIYGIHRK
jgi:hypothetical protein